MKTHILNTPIRDEDLEKIEIGDIVYLNGALITARDQAHHRLVKLGRKLPVDLNRKAILHAGPIMVPAEDVKSGWKVASIGPTTSMRMELFEKEFIEETGVKLIIGKGGMGPNTEAGCREKRQSTASFREAAPSLPPPVLKRSKTISGLNSACPNPCG